jgi:hypothetical protein
MPIQAAQYSVEAADIICVQQFSLNSVDWSDFYGGAKLLPALRIQTYWQAQVLSTMRSPTNGGDQRAGNDVEISYV